MRYMTFLDYTALEASGRSIDSKIQERDMEIKTLNRRDTPQLWSYSRLVGAITNSYEGN